MNNEVAHSALEDENRHSISMIHDCLSDGRLICRQKIWKKKCAADVTMTRMDMVFYELYVAV